jgi:hypothetical protein
VWISNGDGTDAGHWETLGAKSSWVRQGAILLPAGPNNNLPPDLWILGDANLVVVLAIIGGGTSATFKIEHNGVTIPGLSGMVVEPLGSLSAMTFTPNNPEPITFGDLINPVATAISGSPYDLSLVCGYANAT